MSADRPVSALSRESRRCVGRYLIARGQTAAHALRLNLTRNHRLSATLMMLDLEFDLLMMEVADRLVLQTYLDAEQEMTIEQPAETESADDPIVRTRWVPRIREIEGVPADRLAPCHGRLIALGYLQFQLQGRDAGVVYHVTPQGRAVLSAEPVRLSA